MLKLNEELLQFIWRHKLLKPLPLVTQSGKRLSVLDPGEWNRDAGPDFFNAKIRMDELMLAGNIELHIRTSDWLKHNHQKDKNYDTILLHVVYEHDLDLEQNLQHNVEVLVLKPLIDERTLETYSELSGANSVLACSSQLKNVSDLKFTAWLERMAVERLEEKVKYVEQLFKISGGNYAQTFYTCLLKSFGFKVNALPFELIARQLPVYLLLKHSDDRLQLEALLLGISGLLHKNEDHDGRALQSEFAFLQQKYQLKPLPAELFKFSKLRPANFPTQRLKQLAQLIHVYPSLLNNPLTTLNYTELMQMLRMEKEALSLGKASAESILINAFVPFFFFFSKKLSRPDFAEAALELLEKCSAEENIKTRRFQAQRDNLKDASASQGLIHLYDQYCKVRRCLSCGIAAALLGPDTKEPVYTEELSRKF